MSNSTNAILQDAFDLIEQNRLEDARELLEPLLETEGNNPAVWWVYAHALEDPEQGAKALDRVLQLDPTYPGASDLKNQVVASTQPATATETEDAVDDWDNLTFQPESEESHDTRARRSPMRFLLMAIVVIIVVIGIFAVLSALGDSTSQQPTEVAEDTTTSVPTSDVQIITNVSATETSTEVETESASTEDIATEVPTELPEETEEPTEAVPTAEPTEVSPTDIPTVVPTEPSSYVNSLLENLSEYSINESDIETRQTPLGSTLDVSVCALPGAQSSLTLNGVMDVLVELNSELPDDVEAIAVSLVDCENDESTPRTIGVERSFVESLATDEIALKDFQREWKPLP